MKKVERGTDVLRNMGVDGFIGFSVKAKDTEGNRNIIQSFLEFAKEECDDNYTLAIGKLIEGSEENYLGKVLGLKIVELESRLEELEGKKGKDKEVDDGVF